MGKTWEQTDPAMRELVISGMLTQVSVWTREAEESIQKRLPARAERMQEAAEAYVAAMRVLGYESLPMKKAGVISGSEVQP